MNTAGKSERCGRSGPAYKCIPVRTGDWAGWDCTQINTVFNKNLSFAQWCNLNLNLFRASIHSLCLLYPHFAGVCWSRPLPSFKFHLLLYFYVYLFIHFLFTFVLTHLSDVDSRPQMQPVKHFVTQSEWKWVVSADYQPSCWERKRRRDRALSEVSKHQADALSVTAMSVYPKCCPHDRLTRSFGCSCFDKSYSWWFPVRGKPFYQFLPGSRLVMLFFWCRFWISWNQFYRPVL